MKRKEIPFDYMRGNADPYFTLKDKLSMEQQLYKRRAESNYDFKVTDDSIIKFKQLNDILFDIENQILDACVKIESDILNESKWVYQFTDYEISINIYFYSNKLLEAYPDIDYLWRSNSILSFVKPYMVEFGLSKTNWINFNRDHVIGIDSSNTFNLENFTRSFHELSNNSPLSYKDILKIDNIWWNIDVSYQFNKQFKL